MLQNVEYQQSAFNQSIINYLNIVSSEDVQYKILRYLVPYIVKNITLSENKLFLQVVSEILIGGLTFKTYLERDYIYVVIVAIFGADYFIASNSTCITKIQQLIDEPFRRLIILYKMTRFAHPTLKTTFNNTKCYITRSMMMYMSITCLSYVIISYVIMDVYNRAQLSPMYYYLRARLYFRLY